MYIVQTISLFLFEDISGEIYISYVAFHVDLLFIISRFIFSL